MVLILLIKYLIKKNNYNIGLGFINKNSFLKVLHII